MRWNVELRGKITRDVIWREIKAPTIDEARKIALWKYGAVHEIKNISQKG